MSTCFFYLAVCPQCYQLPKWHWPYLHYGKAFVFVYVAGDGMVTVQCVVSSFQLWRTWAGCWYDMVLLDFRNKRGKREREKRRDEQKDEMMQFKTAISLLCFYLNHIMSKKRINYIYRRAFLLVWGSCAHPFAWISSCSLFLLIPVSWAGCWTCSEWEQNSYNWER